MLTPLLTVLPIFAVIAAGYACGRFALLGPTAVTVLNRYVVYLALPALLFEVMATAHWRQLWQPGFIGPFAVGAFGVFGLTVTARLIQRRPLADAAIDGLNAGYANTAYIGLPICQAVFGVDSLIFPTIASVLTISILFATGIVLVEAGLRSGGAARQIAWKVASGLLKNPLVLAPTAGAAWSLAGPTLPVPAEAFVHMIAASASPCALVALGLFVATPPPGATRATPWVFAIIKLIGQPLLTAAIAFVLHIPPTLAAPAILIAALPTGTGPFMLAEFYNRGALITARTVLISTALSVATLSVLIYLLRA
jgi:malonate transporter and related proteins